MHDNGIKMTRIHDTIEERMEDLASMLPKFKDRGERRRHDRVMKKLQKQQEKRYGKY